MKFKRLVLGVTLLFSFVLLAQEKGDFAAFGGVSYPLASGADLGLTIGAEYVFTEKISAAPSFTYYFSGSGITNTDIDIDARYYLGDDSFNWFATAGLSIASISVSAGNFGNVSTSDTGLGIGAGALFNMSESIVILTTVKFKTNRGGVIVPMAGINYRF